MSGTESVEGRQTIDLARVAPFRLGALHVTPATRQVARGHATETLEPRVMQVLVALHQADGAVVSRDELIARCWHGRIVGDNAIQRTISRLRDLAGGMGAGSFRLETVAKVGYRLVALEQPSAAGRAPLPALRRPSSALAAAAAAVLASLLAFFAWRSMTEPAVTRIAVEATPGAESAALADGLAVELARLAGARGNTIAYSLEPAGKATDYVLKIAGRSPHGPTGADVALFMRGAPDLIWSASFSAADRLRERAANVIAGTIECALQKSGDQSRATSAQLRALFAACERFEDDPDEAAVSAWRRAAALEPDNAAVLASLSFVEANRASFLTDQAGALRSAARAHLEKAQLIDPRQPLIFATQALLIPNSHFAERLGVIEQGLSQDDECAILHGLKSEALRNVGYLEQALGSARHAVALDPSSPRLRAELISNLAYSGYAQGARSAIEAALRIWPNSPAVEEAAFRFEFRFGNAAALLRQIAHGVAFPNSPWNTQQGPERALLMARANPTPQNVAAVVALSLKGDHSSYVSLQSLVGVGEVNLAYSFLRDKGVIDSMRDYTEILFRINMRPFVLDRRFMTIADRLGLVRYWLANKTWPDFCSDKDLPYDCRSEARRLHPEST